MHVNSYKLCRDDSVVMAWGKEGRGLGGGGQSGGTGDFCNSVNNENKVKKWVKNISKTRRLPLISHLFTPRQVSNWGPWATCTEDGYECSSTENRKFTENFFFFAHRFLLVFVYLMCGPRQLFFFQCGPEKPKGWAPLLVPLIQLLSFSTFFFISLMVFNVHISK